MPLSDHPTHGGKSTGDNAPIHIETGAWVAAGATVLREVDALIGDATKAQHTLGCKAKGTDA